MPVVIMDSQSQTFQQIMGNGRLYVVPPFQRDYSWEGEQWEDLWDDISSLNEEGQHYMGYVVIQSNKDKEYLIIDGQQRLATISLIILTAIHRINNLIEEDNEFDDNKKRMDEIRRKYVGSLDTISLDTHNKLTLNRNNNSTFRMLSSLQELPLRKIKKTNKRMLDAYKFFYDKVGELSGEELAEFVENISEGLLFTQITVNDDLNAYKVFETLNSRGVQLSTPDLLKNYLFSVISKESKMVNDEMEHLDQKWENIIAQLGKTDFSYFLRTDWNGSYEHTTKNELFRKIRKKIVSRKIAHEYLNRIGRRAPVYAALSSDFDDFWINTNEGKYKEAQKGLYVLGVFNIKQPYTMLLPAFDKFTSEGFIKLIEYIVCLSIRYNAICKKSSNDQERVYGAIARKITSGEFSRVSHVKNSQEFRRLYPSDEEFMDAFKNKHLYYNNNKKKVRYLLAAIEQNLDNKTIAPYDNTGHMTAEHILPQNVTEYWKDIFEDDSDESIDRLGNILLLNKNDNSNAGRYPFEDKKLVYKNSSYIIAEKVSTYEKWDKEQLNHHQKWLAEQAVKTWSIKY